ncbi:sulfur carrier protein ThiS [Zhongshania marina]|jgi:sulfur carrier protein|uniref:Thiamine biosynthesis protein ThiS n=1 Tax=Zhongshania marina TaxID=2304603 RepID=A0A2S4HFA0_9GAMM|nr:sulfur carrier protein ThiS [Marortus luteolus]POP52648.1 thiamine biosynthesis protein ThiS [Marortus luteolus]
MITVSVNNERKECSHEQPLSLLLSQWNFDAEKVAIAVNEDFVPRSQYEHYCLEDGDKVDVLAPVQGG